MCCVFRQVTCNSVDDTCKERLSLGLDRGVPWLPDGRSSQSQANQFSLHRWGGRVCSRQSRQPQWRPSVPRGRTMWLITMPPVRFWSRVDVCCVHQMSSFSQKWCFFHKYNSNCLGLFCSLRLLSLCEILVLESKEKS